MWISSLISQQLRNRLEKILGNENAIILYSDQLFAELKDVVSRPKFQKYLTDIQITSFLQFLFHRLDKIEVYSQINICRDPNDDFILSLCKDGKADYLITGDADLLILSLFENTQILTLSSFENQILFNEDKKEE